MKETRDTFHGLAPKLRTFTIDDVLYARFQRYGKAPYTADDGAVFREINSPRHSVSTLFALLKDNDPKVRTLAIAALYGKEDPAVLPSIAALVDDAAKTYPEPTPIANIVPPEHIPVHDKTVGQIAEAVVRFYLEAAGYYYGTHGSGKEPGFTQYWNQRKDRKYCASWFAIKLRRACGGANPTDKTRIDNIRSVRHQLDQISNPERNWIILWLQTENGFDLLASPTDVTATMKQLGADRLMQMLQSRIVSDDPDLQPRKNNNSPYKSMQLSVLKNAKRVLRADQSEALLVCDRWERDYQKYKRVDPLITPWWTIAAAQLNPKTACKLLHDQFAHLDEDFYGFQKADLAAALFNQCGIKEQSFLLNCFYDPNSLWNHKQYSNFRPQWVTAIADDHDAKTLLKNLIKDPRFANLNDAAALSALIEVNSKLNHKLIASPELKEKAWHPLGLERACCDLDAAQRQYPKETTQLVLVLKEWRARLIGSAVESNH